MGRRWIASAIAIGIGALLVSAALTTTQGAATRTVTQVEVTNFPSSQAVSGDVTVANLPTDGNGNLKVAGTLTTAAKEIIFVGYTAATFSEQAGLLALNRACESEFPGIRTCDALEVVRMIPPPPLPTTASLIVMGQIDLPVNGGGAVVPFSTCMSNQGIMFNCGSNSMQVACCGQ